MMLTDAGGNILQFALRAADQHHVETVSGQLAGVRLADAFGGAGDYCGMKLSIVICT